MRTAATGQQSLRLRERAYGIGDGDGSQLEQGCLDIGRIEPGSELPELSGQPGKIEAFCSCALRCGFPEVGVREQLLQQFDRDIAGHSPGAFTVVALSAGMGDPVIHEPVARSRVEAGHLPACIRGQPGQVGDAADIENDPVLAVAAEHCLVKRGGERSALAADSHVAAAEVCDCRNAGQCCKAVRVPDLQGEGVAGGGAVTHGLSVRADGRDLFRPGAGTAQQFEDRGCKHFPGMGVGHAETVDFPFTGQREFAKLLYEFFRPGV